MADKIILHCDLNNFFASVALLYNPTLYNLPVAVCGSKEERHGIVLAKNEIAKSYGVKTAEAIWEAKAKCPELVTLKPNYEKYQRFSRAAREIYSRYTDLIEPFGIDECWLDVTGSTRLFGGGREIAERIRREIKEELGITVSVGVSFNKIFAKLGSDYKKPDAVTEITKENFKDIVWTLPASDLLFVGKSTVERLNGACIFTIGDIAASPETVLTRLCGKNGAMLKKFASGLDDSPVHTPTEDDKPKSIGRSVTPDHDILTTDEVWQIFLRLSEDISYQLKKNRLYAGGITVHTRTVSLETKEYSRALTVPLNTAMQIAKAGLALFEDSYSWRTPLRSVGLRAVHLKDDSCAEQMDIFGSADDTEREEKIEDSMQRVRDRYGNDSIGRGRSLVKRE